MYTQNRNIIQKIFNLNDYALQPKASTGQEAFVGARRKGFFGLGAADGSGHYQIDSYVIQTWKNNLSSLSTPKNWIDGKEILNTPWLKNMLESIWNSAYPDIEASGIFSGNMGSVTIGCFLSEFPDQSINDLVNACKNIFNVTYKVEKILNIYNVILEICLHPNKGLLNVGGQWLPTDQLIFFGTANYNPISDRCFKVCTPTETQTNTGCPCDCKETQVIKTVYISKTPAGNNPIAFKVPAKKQICKTTPQESTYQFVCADELQKIKDALNQGAIENFPTDYNVITTEAQPKEIVYVPIPENDNGFPKNIGVQGGVQGLDKQNGYSK
jgi:hypothetical protein